MGLDVYVGSLTRYLARDWETVVQRLSREQGIPFRTIRPLQNDPDDAVTDPAQLRPIVIAWRSELNAALGDHLPAPLDWDESEAAPYFTDKPDWDGLGALALVAAHDEHPQHRLPPTVPDDWGDHPAVRASTADGFVSRYAQLLLPEAWLPGDFEFIFRAPLVGGEAVAIGSAPLLVEQLRALNQRVFGGAVAGSARLDAPGRGAPLVETARFALGMFLQLGAAAVARRLVMKLDY